MTSVTRGRRGIEGSPPGGDAEGDGPMSRAWYDQAYFSWLAVAIVLCCGCGASLRHHVQRVSTPSARTEVAEALDTLERLRADGWVTRMQSGECRRTYHRAGEVVLESGDVIGDIAGVTEENTPPECRAALDALEGVARVRARLETDPHATGVLDAFAAAVAELSPTTRPCAPDDDQLAILSAIVRYEFELSVWAPTSLAWAELAVSCEVPVLGGRVEIRGRDTSQGWAVSSMIVLRGSVLPDAPSPVRHDAPSPRTYVFDDWLAPTTGPWAHLPVVLVQTLALGEGGSSGAIYEVVRASDGWRVSSKLQACS